MDKLREELDAALEIANKAVTDANYWGCNSNDILEKGIEGLIIAGYAKPSEWISVEDELPAYGDPVFLKINGVVQHVTYMLDGDDESCDWFEPYHYEDTDAAVDNNGNLRIEWMSLPRAGE